MLTFLHIIQQSNFIDLFQFYNRENEEIGSLLRNKFSVFIDECLYTSSKFIIYVDQG